MTYGRKLGLAAVVTAVLGVLVAPSAAFAVNAYGQTFVGQAECLSCHGDVGGNWQVSRYPSTAHGSFVTDVREDTAALQPTAGSKWWPTPAFGLSFQSSDVWLMIGSPDVVKEYVTVYRNDTTHTVSGVEVGPISGPADDWWLMDPLTWDPAASAWELEGSPVGIATYFQRCGGCHNLGVTRPTDKTYTLANGGSVTHSTETSYSGLGIQCESCHGTGSTSENHHTTGVGVVRTKQVLKSQTCGQCHVTGTAKEKNYLGKTFSNANGFTTDRDLEDFFDVYGTGYIRASAAMPQPSIPATDTRFYPDGHNKGMNHVYYNEWMLSGHARSLRWRDGSLWSSHGNDGCLECHSGEGFLKSIGYGAGAANDIGILPSTVESDTLNVECGVCHTVHATQGEALGLRVEKGELCQLCHNGEVPEGQEASAGATVHHSQAEMLAGYGLIGVPRPSERFMKDTDCIDCHMPETRAGRISHRFTPMTPGNAEAWNVPAQGDSCTPCHAGRTRSELQGDLDGWKADLDAAAEEASAAIAAASKRAAASTAAGRLLIAAARTNVSFVTADSSDGAHNHPYAKAGLEKAAYFAKAVGASIARFGATSYDARSGLAAVYGKLVLGDGSVRAGERVTIEARAEGSTTWSVVATVDTIASGDFSCPVGPKRTTSYRARWTPLNESTALFSGVATVNVAAAPRMSPTTTSIRVSAAAVPVGGKVTIAGAVTPRHAGAGVVLEYRIGSQAWRKLAVRRLDRSSAYSYSFKPGSSGTWYFRAVFPRDASHWGSTSGVVTVRVY